MNLQSRTVTPLVSLRQEVWLLIIQLSPPVLIFKTVTPLDESKCDNCNHQEEKSCGNHKNPYQNLHIIKFTGSLRYLITTPPHNALTLAGTNEVE